MSWNSENGWGAGGATPLQKLKKSGLVLLLDPNKANGVSKGVNTNLPGFAFFDRALRDLAKPIGKNLFDFNGPVGFSATATRQLLKNGFRITANGTAEIPQIILYYQLKPLTKYTLSAIVNNLTSLTRRISVRNSVASGIADLYVTGSVTFTTDANGTGSIYFQANTGSYTGASSVEYTDIQIEEGEVYTGYEPFAPNNACLQKFAGTKDSGFVDKVVPSGKTKTYLKVDKVDDVMTLRDTDDVNITGTEDIAFGLNFITSSSLAAGYVIYKGLVAVPADIQYAILLQADGSMTVNVGGVSTNGMWLAGTLQINTNYTLVVERINGRLKAYFGANPTPTKDVASIDPMVSGPNFSLAGRPASADGTTFATLTNIFYGPLAIARGTKGDISQFRSAFLKYCKDYF